MSGISEQLLSRTEDLWRENSVWHLRWLRILTRSELVSNRQAIRSAKSPGRPLFQKAPSMIGRLATVRSHTENVRCWLVFLVVRSTTCNHNPLTKGFSQLAQAFMSTLFISLSSIST